jgi:RimJ/RimL family protein N-acetyltransferase
MSSGHGPYRIMAQNPVLTDGDLSLRAVEPEHIEAIRNWRNDQMDVLRQSAPITAEAQLAYFERAIWPDKVSKTPANILLGLFEGEQIIGYGGLVHIAWDYQRAEISFLLDSEIADDPAVVERLFGQWLRLMQTLAFDQLGLSRLTTETYEMRALYLRLLDKAGFQREGRLRDHVVVDGRKVASILHGCLVTDIGQSIGLRIDRGKGG